MKIIFRIYISVCKNSKVRFMIDTSTEILLKNEIKMFLRKIWLTRSCCRGGAATDRPKRFERLGQRHFSHFVASPGHV